MVPLLLVSLAFSMVTSAPTSTQPSTTTLESISNVTQIFPEDIIAMDNSTDTISNETETTFVGIRGSIQKEIVFLRTSFESLRQDIEEWMEAPNHRDMVVPAGIGIMSALATMILYCFMRMTCRRCVRKFRRTRLSRVTCDLNGDKQRILPRKDESDDDLLIDTSWTRNQRQQHKPRLSPTGNPHLGTKI